MTSYGAGVKRFVFYDLTATDKKTGLMWTRDANIAGRQMDWDKANDYIKQLNKQKYAGYNDWRLPTGKEFQILTDWNYDDDGPRPQEPESTLLNKIGFKNVQEDFYWSSSTYGISTTYKWRVDMHGGDVFNSHWNSVGYVWPVRAGQ